MLCPDCDPIDNDLVFWITDFLKYNSVSYNLITRRRCILLLFDYNTYIDTQSSDTGTHAVTACVEVLHECVFRHVVSRQSWQSGSVVIHVQPGKQNYVKRSVKTFMRIKLVFASLCFCQCKVKKREVDCMVLLLYFSNNTTLICVFIQIFGFRPLFDRGEMRGLWLFDLLSGRSIF